MPYPLILTVLTGDEITFDAINLITKFGFTDTQRYDTDWIRFKRDEIRAYFIQQEYRQKGFVNPVWLQDLNVIQFTPVKESDIDYGVCGGCNISKANIPQHIPLYNPDTQNEDNGLKIMSPCGKDNFYYLPLETYKYIPNEHPRKKFNYYFNFNDSYFVTKKYNTGLKLRVIGCFERPSDINNINNLEVTSGQISIGVSYTVINFQVVYNGLGYNVGQTFIGVAGQSTYTGAGSVILTNEIQPYSEQTSTYPVTNAMARMIVIEMLAKEFGIEQAAVSAYKNDIADDNTQITNKAAQI